jgi:hypothetical protein
MSGANREDGSESSADHDLGGIRDRESDVMRAAAVVRRVKVGRAIGRHRLEDFQQTLAGLAIAVFGEQATVVPHLRTSSGRQWVTFVIGAADPTSVVQYEDFLPRERAFWTAYAQIEKPVGAQIHGGGSTGARVVPR